MSTSSTDAQPSSVARMISMYFIGLSLPRQGPGPGPSHPQVERRGTRIDIVPEEFSAPAVRPRGHRRRTQMSQPGGSPVPSSAPRRFRGAHPVMPPTTPMQNWGGRRAGHGTPSRLGIRPAPAAPHGRHDDHVAPSAPGRGQGARHLPGGRRRPGRRCRDRRHHGSLVRGGLVRAPGASFRRRSARGARRPLRGAGAARAADARAGAARRGPGQRTDPRADRPTARADGVACRRPGGVPADAVEHGRGPAAPAGRRRGVVRPDRAGTAQRARARPPRDPGG
jgi:hypothetical protein